MKGLDVRPGVVDAGSVVDAAASSSSTTVAGTRSTTTAAAAGAILPTAEQAPWDGKDAQAHALIALSVKRDIIPHIRSAKTTKQAWDILADLYAGLVCRSQ